MSSSNQPKRPQNAFILFCNKNRAVVKRNNLLLENRKVTKILAQWWNYLDEKNKIPFQVAADHAKREIYQENPNFEWKRPKFYQHSIINTRREAKKQLKITSEIAPPFPPSPPTTNSSPTTTCEENKYNNVVREIVRPTAHDFFMGIKPLKYSGFRKIKRAINRMANRPKKPLNRLQMLAAVCSAHYAAEKYVDETTH